MPFSAVFASLWRHRFGFFFWLGSCSVLFLVYGLYGLLWGPAIYAALLNTFLAAGMWAYAFFRERRDLLCLKNAADQIPYLPPLPENDSWEKAYKNLALALEAYCHDTLSYANQEQEHSAQYYTLWSHQIKTPIAAMRLLLQENNNRYAFEQELFKTEQYVDMVLQYQRLGSPSKDLVLKEYLLEDLVRQAARRVSILFIHKKIALHLGPIPGKAITDEKWIVFVLEQLFSNAVKYTPSGGKVSVSSDPENPASLIVSDTGIGIRPEDLPRVTEWGYTGCNGRLENRSTGIGLSLCAQTLDMLGHSMRIQSQLGAGTQVFLYFSVK